MCVLQPIAQADQQRGQPGQGDDCANEYKIHHEHLQRLLSMSAD
jgi:hypothetical protein